MLPQFPSAPAGLDGDLRLNQSERLFVSDTVQMCVRAEKQPIIAYRRAGVEDAAVAGKGILSELLKLWICVQHKCPSIATHRNDLSVNHHGRRVKLWSATAAFQALPKCLAACRGIETNGITAAVHPVQMALMVNRSGNIWRILGSPEFARLFDFTISAQFNG